MFHLLSELLPYDGPLLVSLKQVVLALGLFAAWYATKTEV